jgi:hypothetical protein
MRHYVLMYMDNDQDRSESHVEYQGEFDKFPVKLSYWNDNNYLVVPIHFESREAALGYIEKIEKRITQTWCIVHERHYPDGDPRIAEAIIVTSFSCYFPIHPEEVKREDCTVRTMYLPEEAAEQYVAAFNADIKALKK